MGGDSGDAGIHPPIINLSAEMDELVPPNFWLQFERRTRAAALQQTFFLQEGRPFKQAYMVPMWE
jgi:hypothetical protein